MKIDYNKIGSKMYPNSIARKACVDGKTGHRKNKYGKCLDCGKVFAVSSPYKK